jgi:putative sigma-54 modulation protein
MQLNVTFRHMDSSDFLREYAREKVERVNKYLERAGEASVVFSLERHLHHVDVTITSGRYVLRGHEKSEDMYASIDLAMDKIERQLRRYKERLKHHHSRTHGHHNAYALAQLRARHAVVEIPAPEDVPAPAGDSAVPEAATPRVVATRELDVRPMTVDEAAMQMDLLNDEFLVFQNATTGELNVIYRRKEDGKYGLIEAHAPRAA